jgi:very-short-patch-repair endonuclease
MRHKSATVEQKIAAIANRQQGVVGREQVLRAGVTLGELRHRLETGALLREYRGVYRVGHRAPSTEARYMAAVKACGKGALLSGRAAGYLHGLIKGHPPPPEVTVRTKRRVRGIRTRRARAARGTMVRGIPVTTVPQTLVDLAACLSLDDLARACHEAGVRYGTTPAQVEAVLARRPNVPGAGKLRTILRGDVHVTLSIVERGLLSRLREAGLPLPQTNRPAGGRRIDCRWPDRRVTVEVDGYRFHNSRHAWEQDRRREREAYARGDEFRRYTYGDVIKHPSHMLKELSRLLA